MSAHKLPSWHTDDLRDLESVQSSDFQQRRVKAKLQLQAGGCPIGIDEANSENG